MTDRPPTTPTESLTASLRDDVRFQRLEEVTERMRRQVLDAGSTARVHEEDILQAARLVGALAKEPHAYTLLDLLVAAEQTMRANPTLSGAGPSKLNAILATYDFEGVL